MRPVVSCADDVAAEIPIPAQSEPTLIPTASNKTMQTGLNMECPFPLA